MKNKKPDLIKINKEYSELQTKFQNMNDEVALGVMLQMIQLIADGYTRSYCKKKGLRFTEEHIEDVASNTMCRILTRYRKNKDYTIRSITSICWFDWFKVVTQSENKRTLQQRFEDNVTDMEGIII